MQFFYESHSNKSGIYKIINTHTNRIYIGQAAKFERRWYDHKRHLLNGKHQNKFLLNDFNKCKQELGHDDFLEFYILEIMKNSTKEERNHKEEFYIASVYDKQELCYNFHEKTEAKERSCFSLTPEETKKKISESVKKALSKPETKIKLIGRLSGNKHPQFGKTVSEEHKKKIKEANIGRSPPNKGKKIEELYGEQRAKEIKEQNSISSKGRIPKNKGKTLEELHGEEKAKEIRKKLSEARKRFFKDHKII